MKDKVRLAILISGGGSTMEQIINSCNNGQLSSCAEVVCVVASNPNAGGIEKAKKAGIKEVLVLGPKKFDTPAAFGEQLITELTSRSVDVVSQNGWIPRTPDNVIWRYGVNIFNQHPGPLRADHVDFGGQGMRGRCVHDARLRFVQHTGRNFWTEATYHRVVSEMDKGSVLRRRKVRIHEGDTTETLQARVLPIEHGLVIDALWEQFNGGARIDTLRDDLVLPDEHEILAQVKAEAIQAWPKG